MAKVDVLQQWRKRTCVLATMHHKEKVIAPLFQEALAVSVVVPNNFNTDTFGTFTRDIKRHGNQLQTARAKAEAAMKLCGYDLALASEGSFGTHPTVPFLHSNLELVLLIDAKNNLEIAGHARSSRIRAQGKTVQSTTEALSVAHSWGFPQQGIIVRTSEKSNRNIYKDITTIVDLEKVSTRLLSRLFTKSIFLETDMRAHRCPARRETIKEATLDLIKNCQSLCPQCHTPGFVVTDVIKGLPCNHCGLPTEGAVALTFACQKCNFTENKPASDNKTADPSQCQWCNP